MMKIDPAVCTAVLQKHGRAIVHLRQQMDEKRFGLVFGAGASIDLGFPSWKQLVDRIAKHPKVKGTSFVTKGRARQDTSLSQLLYQHFRAKHLANLAHFSARTDDQTYSRAESQVQANWQAIVHDALYRGVPKRIATIIKRDQYLGAFLKLIRETRLTINYNFDNTIQRMLDETRHPDDKRRERGHSTVWSGDIQMFARDGVIYHPNGFLPEKLRERTSEQLIFLEDSFADQLIESMAGHYTALSYHLAQSTNLLLGLSLADPTLKHLLRQNSHCHPGHYQYYVAFVDDEAKRDREFEETVTTANFEVYNLITLFLKRTEIAGLGYLLGLPDIDFRHMAEDAGLPTVLKFLLTGSVAVGKSTAVSHFRSLRTHDEWLDQRAPGMEIDPKKLDSRRIREIDEWVLNQINLKNIAMMDAKPGIHIVDRAPLDAFAFTPSGQWRHKATLIKTAVSAGKSKRELVPAHVILMIGEPDVMAVRAIGKHKVTDGPALKLQQELITKTYRRRHKGVTVVDTKDKTIRQVVKEIARIIHLQAYCEAPLHKWLNDIERGTIHV